VTVARGVAMVEEDVSDTELAELGARGVHGLRLDLFKRAELRTGEVFEYIVRSGRQAQKLGWHLQFYVPGGVVRDLVPYLGDLDVDFVIDHMGYMLESDGLTRSDFDRLLDVMQRGCGWFEIIRLLSRRQRWQLARVPTPVRNVRPIRYPKIVRARQRSTVAFANGFSFAKLPSLATR